jgi:hypothetical protein
MRKFAVFIIYFLLSLRFMAAQSTIQVLPNTTNCRYTLAIDAGDTIWTGSNLYGLQRYFNGNVTSFNTSNSGILNNRCEMVAMDSSGNIWCGSSNGIAIYNHNLWSTITIQNSGLPDSIIRKIAHTSNGAWIGTNKGITYFDGTNWTVYNTTNSGILNDTIIDIAVDNNIIYIAHSNGISRYNGTWTTWSGAVTGLGSTVLRLQIAAGRLWASQSNFDIFYLDQNNFINLKEKINNFNPRWQYFNTQINFRGMCADESGNFYLLTNYIGREVIKIAPDLSITKSPLSTIGSLNTIANPFCLFKQNKIYYANSLSSIGMVTIDTNAFINRSFHPTENDFLDVNNTTARILNRGDMHWDPIGQYPQYYSSASNLKNPVYCSAIWLGGIDQGGQLHTAAMTYRQQASIDFWTGPLDTITGQADTISEKYYDRFWKIDYSMVRDFQTNFQNGNLQNGSYTLPEAIATWPAHGIGNHTRHLAPFVDVNNDGVYNPYDGDYPELTGHQMLWWVFNDTANIHTETQGAAFGLEIQGKAYGFNCNLNSSADEVMNNTTFYQYKITNRSQNTYSNIYLGLWTDFDLGNASDDYVGCDTMLNTYFCYNGDNNDDGNYGYGLNPPMMNVTVLRGPEVQSADNYDNNHNGLIDEFDETSGLSTFHYYVSVNNTPTGDPANSQEYYYYLTSRWADGLPVTFGESGRNPANPPTNYMFSGTPYVFTPSNWTMVSAGILPDDMRGVGSCGPFTLAPSESHTIDFAYIFTRDSLNPNGLTTSIAKNTADVQKIINGFNSGSYPCLTSVGMPHLSQQAFNCTIYPNPTSNSFRFNEEMIGASYKIYSVTGQLIANGVYTGNAITTNQWLPQVYIIKADLDGKQFVKRLIRL